MHRMRISNRLGVYLVAGPLGGLDQEVVCRKLFWTSSLDPRSRVERGCDRTQCTQNTGRLHGIRPPPPFDPPPQAGWGGGRHLAGNAKALKKILFRLYWNWCSLSGTIVWCNLPPPPPLRGNCHVVTAPLCHDRHDIGGDFKGRGGGYSRMVPRRREGLLF